MKRYLMLIAIIVLAAAATSVWAQADPPAAPNAGYEITWYTIDGGGGTSSYGAYTLAGTIGQADAGSVMNGGPFTFSGGFWSGAASAYHLYLPLVLRS